MNDIDFEKIRTDAFNIITEKLTNDWTGEILKSCAKISSDITKQMLTDYHKLISESSQK